MYNKRKKDGTFKKKPLNYRVVKDEIRVSIWNKGNLHMSKFSLCDLELLKSLNSICLRAGYTCCRYRYENSKKDIFKQITRIIMNCPDDMDIDHINGDKLDNRRCNLRILTHKENCMHRPLMNKNNKSGYHGVTLPRYQVSVIINGKRKTIGTFETLEEAKFELDKVEGKVNRKANKQSKTGIRGINLVKPKAWVKTDNKRVYLGSYDTVEEANEAILKFNKRKE